MSDTAVTDGEGGNDTGVIAVDELEEFIEGYRVDAETVKEQPELVEGGQREGVAYADGLLSVCGDLEALISDE